MHMSRMMTSPPDVANWWRRRDADDGGMRWARMTIGVCVSVRWESVHSSFIICTESARYDITHIA